MYFPRGTPNNISKTCHKNEEPNQMCPYVDSLIMDGEPTVKWKYQCRLGRKVISGQRICVK